MMKTDLRIAEIEDVYETLILDVFFDNYEDFKKFYFSIYFDIQQTLDGKIVLNICNKHFADNEPVFHIFKSCDVQRALKLMDVLIKDRRYIGKQSYSEAKFIKGKKMRYEKDSVDTYKIRGAEVARLRSIRNKLLEIISYF